ncbi:MAG: 2-oxo acid dehydrogenase subunit E2 [Deltaproteobacteria bacterium]|nr:2-oxo acid dehydrogenase subunit E2 [Deltaproteobacteria bacterium]
MAEFVMPSLGADMTAGTLAKWCVAVGDTVSQGDIIAEVETDKGLIEVEVFEAGVVEKLLIPEGEKVPVGTALAEIGTGAESVTASASVPASVPESVPESVTASEPAPVPGSIISAGASEVDLDGPMASPAVRRRAHELDVALEGVHGSGDHGRITLDDVRGVAQTKAAPVAPSDRVRISPYARRIATGRGVDIAQVRGTGPGGAIQASDVLGAKVSALEPSKSSTPAERMQRAIAAAMTRANDEIPHYYVEQSIDMGNALAWLRETNASLSVSERLVSGVLVLRAVARALRKHKKLNATWQGAEAVPREEIHVGLAVSLRGGGLVAPALRNTDEGSLSELMARMTDLVARARSGTLRSSEMTSATITLTSLGERGVESVTPIIFPPQVAIVGCGATAERPWVIDGQVVARPVMRVTLGADHRVSNGHQGARFLSALDRLLQEPEKL